MELTQNHSCFSGVLNGKQTWQIRIPKPEFFGDFGEIPLLNHLLG